MRINIFIAALAVLAQMSCSEGIHRADNAAPEVKKFFNEAMLGIIDGADSAVPYHVKPDRLKVIKGINLYGYPVISRGPSLTASQLLSLKDILLDEKIYDFKRAKKACIHPDFAIVLKKGIEEVTLFMDFNSKQILFVYKGDEKGKEYNNADKKLKALVGDVFSWTVL